MYFFTVADVTIHCIILLAIKELVCGHTFCPRWLRHLLQAQSLAEALPHWSTHHCVCVEWRDMYKVSVCTKRG